jgi:hypothetical protein
MYGLGTSVETEEQWNTQKTSISRAFNKHFFEFIDDVISIYPENEVLRGARNSFEMFKKANPTSIIKVWYKYIYAPYKDEIEAGNLDYFLDKDYSKFKDAYKLFKADGEHENPKQEWEDKIKLLFDAQRPSLSKNIKI